MSPLHALATERCRFFGGEPVDGAGVSGATSLHKAATPITGSTLVLGQAAEAAPLPLHALA
ncbi:MAG: hypothetical protein ACPGUV_07700 [Polyangiales bacterium]